MTEPTVVPFVTAMAAPGGANPSFLVQILPFALMLGIFYLLVLLPMRKRQKKVAEFQSGLKVGDRIITTSGIYGQITRVGENSIRVQIADKVQIEVTRASVGGYQGQDPVVTEKDAAASGS